MFCFFNLQRQKIQCIVARLDVLRWNIMGVLDRGVVDRKQGKGERSQEQSIAKDVSSPSDPTIAPPR